jgi:hypothetical protein
MRLIFKAAMIGAGVIALAACNKTPAENTADNITDNAEAVAENIVDNAEAVAENITDNADAVAANVEAAGDNGAMTNQ